jgi:hypothetical protein
LAVLTCLSRSKPQTLFKKTSSKNFEAAKGGALMFADIPKNAPKEDEDTKMQDA